MTKTQFWVLDIPNSSLGTFQIIDPEILDRPEILGPSGDPGPDSRSDLMSYKKSFYTDDLIYDIKIKKTICEKKIRHKTEL